MRGWTLASFVIPCSTLRKKVLSVKLLVHLDYNTNDKRRHKTKVGEVVCGIITRTHREDVRNSGYMVADHVEHDRPHQLACGTLKL